MTMQRCILWLIVACYIGVPAANADTTPTDVYYQLLHVGAEVDLIRQEMGVADLQLEDIAISAAQPREVYFQALTLFEKANRLMFEQLRERADLPAAPATHAVKPDDVLVLVNASLLTIVRVKESFGIPDIVSVNPATGAKTPTDVYQLTIRVNRMLNSLLKQQFEPADVYQQVTYGVGLTAGILTPVAATRRLGTEPALVRRKTPTDVYRHLVDSYQIIHEIMKISGEQCLVIEAAEYERENVTPSDVYDLASLIVSELSYLNSIAPNKGATRESFYPGDKLPSHVYQRVERLQSQLHTLRRYASANPDWLRQE